MKNFRWQIMTNFTLTNKKSAVKIIQPLISVFLAFKLQLWLLMTIRNRYSNLKGFSRIEIESF